MRHFFPTILFGIVSGLTSAPAFAANPDSVQISGCSIHIIPVDTPVKLDGKLDEFFWLEASEAQNFVQRTPQTGAPASQETVVRVVISGGNLIIGAEMFDSAPDSVANTLFRKDGSVFSDWFAVGFDSYNDRRTSFTFEVNPRGVRRDFMFIDDRISDYSWEAVWQAATASGNRSWTVEIRIPLSQLRYSAGGTPIWGINFARFIARRNEWSYWAPTPPEIPGIVSHFGVLTGVEEIKRVRRVEIIPYLAQQLKQNGTVDPANPFVKEMEPQTNAGVDIRLGIGSNFTMTTAVNPDFGQAEVDPAVVNLSAFEVFFPERRSFFLEGMEIFRFGQTRTFNISQRPTFFYSRRIGRAPSVSTPESYSYADIPANTTIAAASKFSGKTPGGFSLGLLNAVTTTEFATFLDQTGERDRSVAEPASNFFAGRVRQDFRSGNSFAGAFLTTTHRRLDRVYLKPALRNEAFLGGLDFEHNWNNRQLTISGTLAGSLVKGDSTVMLRTQRSNIRSFQRPDASYLSVDSSKTSLTGYWSELAFARRSGRWVSSLSLMRLSPGFEVNDLGFQTMADRQGMNLYQEFQQNIPVGIFQNYSVFTFIDYIWNFGGNMVEHDYFLGARLQFRNFWSFRSFFNASPELYNDRLTRGGPLSRRPSDRRIEMQLTTDSRKPLVLSAGFERRGDTSGEYDKVYYLDINWRPASAINISVSPAYVSQFDTDQYVDSYADATTTLPGGRRYVFADIYQKEFSADIRIDWTFLPDLSLQVFAQPFYTSGHFSRYKDFARAGRFEYNYYDQNAGGFEEKQDGSLTLDPDGSSGVAPSYTIDNQDFNVASLRGNGVLRYEFKPGTIFFLIWQQNRFDEAQNARFNLIDDNNRLFQRKPVNIFLAKISWWFG